MRVIARATARLHHSDGLRNTRVGANSAVWQRLAFCKKGEDDELAAQAPNLLRHHGVRFEAAIDRKSGPGHGGAASNASREQADRMNRRRLLEFIAAGGLAGGVTLLRAQPAGAMPRIGVLSFGTAPAGSNPDPSTGFRQGLRELGLVEGRNPAPGRLGDRAADRVRAGDQPQDGALARHRAAPSRATAGPPVDRMTPLNSASPRLCCEATASRIQFSSFVEAKA